MRKRRNNTHNYWESATDATVGLLMVLLLCLLLVILSFQINNRHEKDLDGTDNHEYAWNHDHADDHYDDDDDYDDYEPYPDDSHGGGGPYAGISDGNGKCAVLVRVVDEDTQKNIQEKDITFEIKKLNGELVVLSTHYPKKVNYNSFATTESGQFYLPEKILTNRYVFNQITDVKGYDRSTGVEVLIDEDHDWDEPFIVTIPLSPSKNTVRVHLIDDEGAAITGKLGVYAKTDISTFDGTIRLKKGELASEIELDENGYGESEELYLGSYYFGAISIPEGYVEKDLGDVTVEKRVDGKEPELITITLSQTAIELILKDSYTGISLNGSEFSLYNDKNNETVKLITDDHGLITARGLLKNTAYHLMQVSAVDGYHIPTQIYDFYVDNAGLIEGEPKHSIDATNYTIRCSIDVKDALLRKHVQNSLVEIYLGDQLIDKWHSEDTHYLEGLETGSYTVRWAGRTKTVQIVDTEAMQRISLSVWSIADIILLVIIVVFICMAIVLLLKKVFKKGEHHGSKE